MLVATKGRHRRPSKAAPVIAGTAIAAGSAVLMTAPAHAASFTPGSDSVPQQLAVQEHQARTVTVKPGDSLSSIAQEYCGSASDWRGIYAANQPLISNPDVIMPDEVLTLRCSTRGGVTAVTTAVTVSSRVDPGSYSGFQECVIERESGGNPDIWNASGHWGLYQFSYSTWVAHGGPPGEFGTASVAEQNRIFWNTVAEDGTSDWAPYDHC